MPALIEIERHHPGVFFAKILTWAHTIQEHLSNALENTRKRHAAIGAKKSKRLHNGRITGKVIPLSLIGRGHFTGKFSHVESIRIKHAFLQERKNR
ncbi:MAG: hypothetical protein WA705_31625 [Candidatus Ozemobacteraceae bacterium]